MNLDVKSRQYAESVRIYGQWQDSMRELQTGTLETRGMEQVEQDLAELASLPTKLGQLREMRLTKSKEIHETLLESYGSTRVCMRPLGDS